MGNLLFSPSGRIGPAAYFKGIMVLGAISAVISLVGLVSPGIAIALGFASFLLIIPFFFLGIKRSHDAGKSGWMSLTHFALYLGLAVLVGKIFEMIMPTGLNEEEIEARAQAAGESGDIGAVMEIAGEAVRATAIPSAITAILVAAALAFLVNMFNKSDQHDNQFGPATTGDS